MQAHTQLGRTIIKYTIVSCLFIYVPSLFSNTKSWFSNYKHKEEQLIELTPKQMPCTLSINQELPGNITVKGWHQNHIAVTAHKKTQAPEDAERIQCTLTQHNNGTIALTSKSNESLKKDAIVNLTVHIPLRATVTIETLENVAIENTQNTIRIKTDNGSITTHTTRGTIYAETDIGDITAQNTHGPLDLYTNKGLISVQESYNSILAETARGSIEVRCAEIPSTANLNLSAHKRGTVTLEIPESTQAHITADTMRGIITSDMLINIAQHTTLLNANIYKDSQKQVNGTIGEQGNANIVINSARGVHILPNK
jgi:F0F1-type ATP synthase epsilon subunit